MDISSYLDEISKVKFPTLITKKVAIWLTRLKLTFHIILPADSHGAKVSTLNVSSVKVGLGLRNRENFWSLGWLEEEGQRPPSLSVSLGI